MEEITILIKWVPLLSESVVASLGSVKRGGERGRKDETIRVRLVGSDEGKEKS